jgi:hypothetical protein
MTEAVEPNGWAIFSAEHIRGRQCGKCTACCTMVPVHLPEGEKPAGVRCRHLRSSGCSIYATRPKPCVVWSCRWLFDDATAAMRRPDLSGYIVDPQLTTFLWNEKPADAVQVWVDPKRPDAHRDPALRDYLARCAERFSVPALIRWGNDAAMALIPPSLSVAGEWLEQRSEQISEAELEAKVAAADAAIEPGRGA